ncbi:MAG: 4Fe-4S binding protein [Candidatus Woesearchaeota archaeon]|jgi:ferredoxin
MKKNNGIREIIEIDEDKCNGCAKCIPNCPEGAMKIIDGKARLISDLFCDGLGACVGHCPTGAITVVKRKAEPYDEKKTMVNIVKKGKNTIIAHLKHLKDHGVTEYYNQAIDYLKENKLPIPNFDDNSNKMANGKKGDDNMAKKESTECGCPGAKTMTFEKEDKKSEKATGIRPSELRQWPVQLHLANPQAPYFIKKDVVLAADCTAFAYGDFHKDFLKDKSVVIACPKLDDGQEVYIEKLTSMIKDSKINTLTVLTMEVPCCFGLVEIARQAKEKSGKKIPIKSVVLGLQGSIVSEDWV